MNGAGTDVDDVDDELGAFFDAPEAPLETQRPFVVWETVAGAAATNWETASMVGGTERIAPTLSYQLHCTSIHCIATTNRLFRGKSLGPHASGGGGTEVGVGDCSQTSPDCSPTILMPLAHGPTCWHPGGRTAAGGAGGGSRGW